MSGGALAGESSWRDEIVEEMGVWEDEFEAMSHEANALKIQRRFFRAFWKNLSVLYYTGRSHHSTFAASINMKKILTFIPILACVLSNTCGAYQLVGTEALSEELVAQHYTINPNPDVRTGTHCFAQHHRRKNPFGR